MQLIISLRDDEFRQYDPVSPDKFESSRGSLVCGARSEFVIIDSPTHRSLMGVAFKPGGGYPFFRLPARELHNASVTLDALWGARAGDFRDRLLEARTLELRFRALEQQLAALADWAAGTHPAVAFALTELECVSRRRTVGQVTDQIGLSARRFIQVFSEQVGLTPKLYCRVRRFQDVLGLIGTGRSVDWPAVALQCGYFDQAHFIHDFRSFSGLSPTAYFTHRGQYRNHVPLLD
jgi:AraC-like DNA-binding protein